MITQCPKCGTSLWAGLTACNSCGFQIPELNSAFVRGAVSIKQIPWENLSRVGLPAALASTISLCIISPSIAFSRIIRSHDIFMAWIYGLIAGCTGILFNYLWGSILTSALFDSIAFSGIALPAAEKTSSLTLVFSPAVVSAEIAATALYCHLLMRLFTQKKRLFSSTFRIVCYSRTASLFNMLPVAGPVLAVISGLFMVIYGESHLFGTGKIKSFLFLTIPAVFLVTAAMVFLVISIGAGIAAGSILKGFPAFFR